MSDLELSSYDYNLPQELIAKRPASPRDASRLLVYHEETDTVIHTTFSELGQYLNSEHHLVLNNSKVFACRLFGQRPTGGVVEMMLLSLEKSGTHFPVMIKSSRKKQVGDEFLFDDIKAVITATHESEPQFIEEGSFGVQFNLADEKLYDWLEANAHIPIPPYIRDGISDEQDKSDYQTVYAQDKGSVAAPTAGLHFTENVFQSLEEKGIDRSFVTLHVGAGTFKPVKSELITDHQMHSENYSITSENLSEIKSHYPHLIAVGTTSLRVLESSFTKWETNENIQSSTNLFLHPGTPVNSIAGMITNFHLPKSSLIMLVSALIGREKTLELYKLAVKERYRFFSYGDAMLILRKRS